MQHQIKVSYSNRKSISMQISDDLIIQIKAPYYTPKKQIEQMVEKNISWINKNIKKKKEQNRDKVRFEFGKSFPLLGTQISIKKHKGRAELDVENHVLLVPESTKDADVQEIATTLLKKYARNYYQFKLDYFAQVMNLSYEKFRLSSGEKTVGSCNSNSSINLSWKTIFYPEKVSDYIIIHELAHLKELNHSKNFWAVVQRYCPNYKEIRKYLRNNSYITKI